MDSSEGEPPSRRPEGVSKALSAVAVALAAVALVLSATLPGPVGPRGDTGATGPPGPQGVTVMAAGSKATPQLILYQCYAYANVSIAVPGPGTVVVSASVRFNVTHTLGTQDVISVALDLVPGRCADDAHLTWWSPGHSAPTDTFNETLFPQKDFAVLTAATYTYYVSGYIWPGEPGSWFLGASLVAVFYPM